MPGFLLTALCNPHRKITSHERVCVTDRLWKTVLQGPVLPLSSVASFDFSQHGGEIKSTEQLLARLAASYAPRLRI